MADNNFSEEKARLLQRGRQAYIKNAALKGPWVTLFQLESHTDGLSLFCALTAKERRAALLEHAGWELRIGRWTALKSPEAHLGEDVTDFDLEALWDDTRTGLQYFTAFEKIAIITDITWLKDTIKMFGVFRPCPVKTFSNAEFVEAALWINA